MSKDVPAKKKRIRYEQVYDDEWVTPRMKGWRMKCCDCGLVHEITFKVAGSKRPYVKFRARRLTKAKK